MPLFSLFFPRSSGFTSSFCLALGLLGLVGFGSEAAFAKNARYFVTPKACTTPIIAELSGKWADAVTAVESSGEDNRSWMSSAFGSELRQMWFLKREEVSSGDTMALSVVEGKALFRQLDLGTESAADFLVSAQTSKLQSAKEREDSLAKMAQIVSAYQTADKDQKIALIANMEVMEFGENWFSFTEIAESPVGFGVAVYKYTLIDDCVIATVLTGMADHVSLSDAKEAIDSITLSVGNKAVPLSKLREADGVFVDVTPEGCPFVVSASLTGPWSKAVPTHIFRVEKGLEKPSKRIKQPATKTDAGFVLQPHSGWTVDSQGNPSDADSVRFVGPMADHRKQGSFSPADLEQGWLKAKREAQRDKTFEQILKVEQSYHTDKTGNWAEILGGHVSHFWREERGGTSLFHRLVVSAGKTNPHYTVFSNAVVNGCRVDFYSEQSADSVALKDMIENRNAIILHPAGNKL